MVILMLFSMRATLMILLSNDIHDDYDHVDFDAIHRRMIISDL